MRQRVCFPGSLYVFTFYLLMSSKEEILNTLYFFDKNIHVTIRNKMPKVHFLKEGIKNRYALALCSLINKSKYPELNCADIFGLDFRWDILRGHQMNYIEDAPSIFDIWETSPMYRNYIKSTKSNLLKKWARKMIFGNYYGCPVATSSMVTDIYTSSPVEKPYLNNKRHHVVDLRKEWNDSPQEKKDLILSIFDVSQDTLKRLQSRKIILLTQAFSDDHFVTDKEQIEIYRKILSHYNEEDVVMKPHPRDKIDYRKFFPKVMYFDKVVAMQFLAILGVTFERVVTVSSSSALTFGIDVPIDWYGYKVHPGILKGEGIRTLENAKKNYLKSHGKK
ncbi:glycosyltransferase family 52 [Prevotella multiformis]|uniref:glycosyltransferase family 52 n=1 Tax=Prevotella multiformis TaxID=282402 RepID=UPI0028DD33BC|nr:glycosyltransferase family 52 [Prevotella multiformis]